MTISLVDNMAEQPGVCLNCGGNPPNDDGTRGPFITFEGIDVNWGDSVYICPECYRLIADLTGHITIEEGEKLTEANKKLRKEKKALEEKYERYQARVKQVLEGRKAEKEVKAA